jgi:MFS family permease
MTQSVAQSWLVFQLTGRAFDLGVLAVVTWTPVLLGAVWGGGLADRVDLRRLLVVTQALFVALNAGQAALIASGQIQLWMVFALGAVNGAVMAVDAPARQVYVFRLVGPLQLASAVGLFEVVINASRVLGPAVGGALLAAIGTAPCFVFNALSYLPMLIMLARLGPGSNRPSGEAPTVRRGSFADALRLVLRHPEIRSCMLIALAGSMLFDLSVAAPPFVSQVLHLGGGGYGALMAAFGLGALPGALAAAAAPAEPSGRRLRVLAAVTGVAVVGTALSPGVPFAFAAIAVSGFTSIWLIAGANTLAQLRTSPGLRGRVMGIWTMILPGSYPLTGMVVAATSAASPRAGFALSGAALGVVALATWTGLGRTGPGPGLPPE